MADIVTMPKLGFDMAEGTLVRWVVAEGEEVKKGGILAEIETDKATVEVESTHEGVVARHLVDEGTPVPVGDPIAVIGAPGEEVDVDQLLPDKPGKKYMEEAPPGGEGGPGSAVAPEAETGLRPDAPVEDQEALPRESETEAAEEEAARGERQRRAPAAAEEVGIAKAEVSPDGGRLPEGVRASPLARRIADERGIDLRRVKGTGPGGRIVKSDIEEYKEAAPPKPEPRVEPERARPAAPAPALAPEEEREVPLSRLRSIIARRMTEAKQQVPHFYVTYDYDMAALMDLRKQVNAKLPEDQKTSVNDYILKAVALTLREFPNLNASLDEKNNQIIQHGQINVGVAVAVENGLLTVVCHNTDLKSIRQISAEVRTMVARAREGKVRPEDIEGSTFSVSNLGMYGVEEFVAIINPPEAAILAIGGVRETPVMMDGEIKPGTRMKATISVDHRVSDGAEAARFLQALKKYLEDPMMIVI